MSWHPISTAPKDGTVIDLWAGDRLPDCRWESGDEDLGGLTGWFMKYQETQDSYWWLGGDDFQPTHWMHRPQPPSTEGPKE